MPTPVEWLLALGTHKMLDVPILAQGSNHPLLYGSSASTAYRDAHLIVTSKAVKLSVFLSGINV